jgi:hypothetical protein
MAKCNTCGTEISSFNLERECESCYEIRKDQLSPEKAAQKKQILEKQAEQAMLNDAKAKLIVEQAKLGKNTWIDKQVAGFTSKLSNDAPIYLFQRIYCPVNSRVHDEDLADDFQLGAVEQLGADGWQIVGIVPRTIGIGLKNRRFYFFGIKFVEQIGAIWGGGIGGNVAGVYVLLQLNVTLANVNQLMPSIKGYFDTKYRAPN